MEREKILEQLASNTEDALRKIVRKGDDISATELDNAMKVVCLMQAIKNYTESGESGASYRRGRSAVTGRFTSRDSGNSSHYGDNSGRSYDGGSGRYSGHSVKDRMVDAMERMMDDAGSDYERQQVQKVIHMIQKSSEE